MQEELELREKREVDDAEVDVALETAQIGVAVGNVTGDD